MHIALPFRTLLIYAIFLAFVSNIACFSGKWRCIIDDGDYLAFSFVCSVQDVIDVIN